MLSTWSLEKQILPHHQFLILWNRLSMMLSGVLVSLYKYSLHSRSCATVWRLMFYNGRNGIKTKNAKALIYQRVWKMSENSIDLCCLEPSDPIDLLQLYLNSLSKLWARNISNSLPSRSSRLSKRPPRSPLFSSCCSQESILPQKSNQLDKNMISQLKMKDLSIFRWVRDKKKKPEKLSSTVPSKENGLCSKICI